MNQSCAFLLSYVKTNQSCICARVPQSSSLPQSCAEEKSSGVEIVIMIFSSNNRQARHVGETTSFPGSPLYLEKVLSRGREGTLGTRLVGETGY